MSDDMPAILREQAKYQAGVITRVQGVAMGTRFDDWAAGRGTLQRLALALEKRLELV